VALTAMRQPDTRDRCLATGMDEHLTKPVNTDQLYDVIQRILAPPATP
jgi:CheY-like chemotaxis protein